MKNLFLVLLLCLPLSVAAHDSTEFADMIDKTVEATVFVENTPISKKPTIGPWGKTPDEKPEDEERKASAIGTGFIVEHGYIVTNHHVIENHEKLEVYFEDENPPYEVTLVAADAEIDIAILKVGDDFPRDFEPLKWCRNELRRGQDVWALGHPHGFTYSVTKGIISHLDRRIASPWQPAIQTDTAINQGNSGGPLLTMDGCVAGINVMIYSQGTAAFAGIALAITADTASRAYDLLLLEGEIKRPMLGAFLGYSEEHHLVYVEDLTDDSPAERAGLKGGDLFLEIEGNEVQSTYDIFDVLAVKQGGDKIKLKMKRDGEVKTFTVTLGERPDERPPQ